MEDCMILKNDIVDRLKSDKEKLCKYFYKLYLENIEESPFKSLKEMGTGTRSKNR